VGLMLFFIINQTVKKRRFKHFERSRRLRVVSSKYTEKVTSKPRLALVIPPTKARTHASVTSSPLRQAHTAQPSPPQGVRLKLCETLRDQTPLPGTPLSPPSSPWTSGSSSGIENENSRFVEPDRAIIQQPHCLVRSERPLGPREQVRIHYHAM
jgi:hypothetical protein